MSDIRSTPDVPTDLADDTTHILHFAHYCGATRLDKARGLGLWLLVSADEYNMGYSESERDDWVLAASKRTPARELAAWVSARAGYQVTLTRSDEVIGAEWESVVAYQAGPAAARRVAGPQGSRGKTA
jgi:hypothetical protein